MKETKWNRHIDIIHRYFYAIFLTPPPLYSFGRVCPFLPSFYPSFLPVVPHLFIYFFSRFFLLPDPFVSALKRPQLKHHQGDFLRQNWMPRVTKPIFSSVAVSPSSLPFVFSHFSILPDLFLSAAKTNKKYRKTLQLMQHRSGFLYTPVRCQVRCSRLDLPVKLCKHNNINWK